MSLYDLGMRDAEDAAREDNAEAIQGARKGFGAHVKDATVEIVENTKAKIAGEAHDLLWRGVKYGALGAGVALGLWWLFRSPEDPPPSSSEEDRADVVEK